MATTTVYPRLFEISLTLTSRNGYLERVVMDVHPRFFEIASL